MEKTQLIVDAALEMKAEDPVALDVSTVTAFADVFVVVSGRSDRQVRSIADSVEKAMKSCGEHALGIEGRDEARWILMDFDDVIVHIFVAEVRDYYDLERLWADAPPIPLAATTPGAEEAAR